jgi:hypothetical protein
MPPTDDPGTNDFTYNPLTNDEKEWSLRNGYAPGELTTKEIRQQMEAEGDTDDNSQAVGEISDEADGTDADAS